MRQRPERAMGRGVAVAAHDGGAGQGEALLRADDVDDALAGIELVEIFDAELARIGGERLDLHAAFGVRDAVAAVGRLDVVVDDRERLARRPDLAAGHPQAFEGLRARHLMDEMTVDIEQAGAVGLPVDDVVVPDLVVEGPGLSRECVRHDGSLRPPIGGGHSGRCGTVRPGPAYQLLGCGHFAAAAGLAAFALALPLAALSTRSAIRADLPRRSRR